MRSDLNTQVEKRLAEIQNAVAHESIRGKILVLTAHIDNLLSAMLKRFLKAPRAKDRDLLSSFGALGSVRARIETAYRLGLIDKNDADALDVLRKLRNDCAHDLVQFSLDEEPHKERFLNFAERTMQQKNRVLFLGRISPSSTGDYVIWLCIIYVLELEASIARLDRIPDRFIPEVNRKTQVT